MITFIGYIVIYISIIFGSIYISDKFNKKIESTIIIDIFLKMIILYILGLFNQLQIGVIILNAIPILLGIGTLFKRRKETGKLKENILTYGMLFFTIIYFCFIIFTYHKMSNVWDEYSYWSVVSKNMFYSNKLISNVESVPTIYPPFPTILQYYFTKTIGLYSQGIELFATQILGFALLIPLFEQIKTKNKIPIICLSIIILCIPAIFVYITFYQAIYADSIIGLLIGYILYQKYNEKNNKFLLFSLALAFITLSLTKATGFYISLILIGVFTLSNIIKIIREKEIKNIKIKENIKQNVKEIQLIVVLFLLSLIFIISWNINIKCVKIGKTELQSYFTSSEETITIIDSIKTIGTTLFGSNDDSANYDISNSNLFIHLYKKYSIDTPIRITLIAFSLIFTIISLLRYKYCINEDEKINYSSFTISILIGLVVYIAFLQLAYLTKFGIDEAISHASLERYINTFHMGMLIFIIYNIVKNIENSRKIKSKNISYIALTAIIVLITPIHYITDNTITSGVNNAIIKGELSDVINEAEKLKQTLNKEDNIYLVNQICDMSVSSWQIKYFAYPELNIKWTEKFNEELEEKCEKELQEDLYTVWKTILYESYDYVYIYKTDEYFNEFAKNLFKDSTVKDMTIYKIEKENNDIKLVEFE